MAEQCSLCSTIPTILVSPERSSRVSELISNNIPPSQSDRQFMQSLCIDYEDRIRQLNDRASRMEEALAVLTKQRDKFLAHIEDTKAIMHPMRSLPDDVLYEIFSHCIPNWTRDNLRHGQCNTHDSLDVKNAPWTLGQVCSRWRNVVLRLPSLWSTVVLHFPKYRSKDQDHLLARLRLLLERSRACDMTVIAATDYLPSFGIENPMIALLRQTSHRWKYLRIWLSLAFMRNFFHLLPVNRLQQLAIHNGTIDQSDSPFLAESVKLDSAHQLNNLRLSGRRPANLNVTWAHIVDFDAINIFSEHIFSVLPLMVNVRSMKLACGPTRCPSGARPISLHRLKRLKVEEQTPGAGGCIASFLALLDAPILTSLHLLYPRAFATPQLPTDFSGIGRITALRIIGFFGSADSPCPDLVEFLRKANKLTSIRMDMQRIPAGLLRAMAVTSGAEAILKTLECLNLSYTGDEAYDVDPELVLLAAEARARPPVEDGSCRPLVQLRLPRHLVFDKADLTSRWNHVSHKLTITVRGKRWKFRGGGESDGASIYEVPSVIVAGEDDTSSIL